MGIVRSIYIGPHVVTPTFPNAGDFSCDRLSERLRPLAFDNTLFWWPNVPYGMAVSAIGHRLTGDPDDIAHGWRFNDIRDEMDVFADAFRPEIVTLRERAKNK